MFSEVPHVLPETRTPSYSISFVSPRDCNCDRPDASLLARAELCCLFVYKINAGPRRSGGGGPRGEEI